MRLTLAFTRVLAVAGVSGGWTAWSCPAWNPHSCQPQSRVCSRSCTNPRAVTCALNQSHSHIVIHAFQTQHVCFCSLSHTLTYAHIRYSHINSNKLPHFWPFFMQFELVLLCWFPVFRSRVLPDQMWKSMRRYKHKNRTSATGYL